MDFFCSKDNIIKFSNYLFKVVEKHEDDSANRNNQIRIKLPDNTKPDVLLMVIDYIDRGKEFPNRVDLYLAQNIVTIAEALKMRQLEKRFLMDVIMPMLNRENVILMINMAFQKLSSS